MWMGEETEWRPPTEDTERDARNRKERDDWYVPLPPLPPPPAEISTPKFWASRQGLKGVMNTINFRHLRVHLRAIADWPPSGVDDTRQAEMYGIWAQECDRLGLPGYAAMYRAQQEYMLNPGLIREYYPD